MDDILNVKNLNYKEILKDITFSLKEKTFNILIGPNGSGKTTLVNCIRGLLKYNGTIEVFNNNLKEINTDIGFFTEDELFLESTILEELLQLLKNLNYSEEKAKKRIFNVCKKLDITSSLLKSIDMISKQEQTLVSFAFSIIHDPKLLIIDNDLENLNYVQKNRVIEYLKSQKKLTILFITNNSDYFNIADNLLFLNNGKIILTETLDNVISQEKTFIKCGTKVPFITDLSNKLISYGLLDSPKENIEKLVSTIWE